ncbi:hypothetical protein DKX38_003598 [Salix brachista]|uniref:Bifunctional inhibitor/plant lipid transfer protein/seed storage helical domain-containing protein n=1 Tax=Salix brachista TaxID=2182728 RepID=A0A5N5NQE0_9ROSI|nr:hypothetical protein DKX38_003598 [Salix brachista]
MDGHLRPIKERSSVVFPELCRRDFNRRLVSGKCSETVYRWTDRRLLIFMMEMGKTQLVVLLLVMAALFEGSRAVTVCDISDEGLTACKPSVTKPDPVDPPSADCCKAVSGANFTCLCSYKNSYLLPYLGIDPDLAMALPSKCNLSIPTPTC